MYVDVLFIFHLKILFSTYSDIYYCYAFANVKKH